MAYKKESLWVIYAKAIGIILVVIGHVIRGLENADITSPTPFFKTVDTLVYSFHMPLFFILSGIFYEHSFKKYGGKKLILNKLKTILYPYVIWSLGHGLVEIGLSSFTNGSVSFKEVFTLLWNPRAHFWFLYSLLGIFCLMTLIRHFTSSKPVLFTAGIIFFIFSPQLVFIPIFGITSPYFIYFSIGAHFRSLQERKAAGDTQSVLIHGFSSTFFFLLLSYINIAYEIRSFLEPTMNICLALLGSYLVYLISYSISNRTPVILRMIGEASFLIYLLHILATSGIRIILQKFLGIEFYMTHLIFGVIAGILIPVLIAKYKNIRYILSAR